MCFELLELPMENMPQFTELAKEWNATVFGNVFHRNQRVMNRLAGGTKVVDKVACLRVAGLRMTFTAGVGCYFTARRIRMAIEI